MSLLLSLLCGYFLLQTISATCSMGESIDSTLIIYNTDGSTFTQLTDSSTDIGSLNTIPDIGQVTVRGPAMWIIFSGVNYGEPRILLDKNIARTENISRVKSESSSSAKRVGLQCVDRPVG